MTAILLILSFLIVFFPITPLTDEEGDNKSGEKYIIQKITSPSNQRVSADDLKSFKKIKDALAPRYRYRIDPQNIHDCIVLNSNFLEDRSKEILDKYPINIVKPNTSTSYSMKYSLPKRNSVIRERKAPQKETASVSEEKVFPKINTLKKTKPQK